MVVYLSIVIPTYNSFKNKQGSIELTISSIFKQKSINNVEIIIIDDGSSDKTTDYLKSLQDVDCDFDLMLLSKKHDGNRAKSRNLGIQKARGKLILFLDDDTVLLSPYCIKKTIEMWKPQTFLCGAKRYWTYPIWDRNKILELIHSSRFEKIKKMSFVPIGLNRYNGCRDLLEFSFLSNFGVVSREDLINVGGFDEGYTGWGYEETDLMFRLLDRGLKFINLWPFVSVLHLNHPLGESEPHITGTNRERFYEKLKKKGMVFKVNHLFGVFEDDGHEIFLRYSVNRNKRSSLSQYSNNTYVEKKPYKLEFKSNNNDPLISVIISTYNSFENNKGCLELVLNSLKNQTLEGYEVIIVDDGSTDRTPEFISKFSAENLPFNLVYLYLEHSGNRSKCRNIGVKEAHSSLLLFLDSDTIFLSDYALEQIMNIYKPNHFMCGAKRFWTFVTWDRNLFLNAIKSRNYELIMKKCILPHGINRRKGFRDLFEYSFIANCGVVSKKDFENVGGFDEITFDGWGREDVDLMLRLYLNGVGFINLHELISVVHLNHPINSTELKNRELYFKKYEMREKEHGFIFKVNHLFGVFENDGTEILVPIKGGE